MALSWTSVTTTDGIFPNITYLLHNLTVQLDGKKLDTYLR